MAFTVIGNGKWQNAYPGSNAGAGAACSLVDAGNYSGAIGTIGRSRAGYVSTED